MSRSWRGEMMGGAMARDPEVQKLLRRQLALVVEVEKVLTQLEENQVLLRTFVETADKKSKRRWGGRGGQE